MSGDRACFAFEPANLAELIVDVVALLAKTPGVYQQNGHLVRVIGASEDRVAADGSPVIRPHSLATIRELLSGIATFEKSGKKGPVDILPPHELLASLLERGEWRDVPHLAGIVEAPALRPDGTVLDRPGYDPATRFVYAPSRVFPTLPAYVSRDRAKAALAELQEIFADFPYAKPQQSLVPIAAILTMLARPAIVGSVPMIVLDASTRGSGKSRQAHAIAMVATGRPAYLKGFPPDDEETEKVLGSFAMRGATLVCLDNVERPLGGASLNMFLTAVDRVACRILGKSEVPELIWRGLILANGNNIEIAGDTTRRCLVARLESMLENPEDRTDLAHADLLAWVSAHRPRLVLAGLAILRAYCSAGRPDTGQKTWGSFEGWAELVPRAIVWAGGGDVLACRCESGDAVDPEKSALSSVLALWSELGEWVTLRSAVTTLYPPERLSPPRDAPPLAPDRLDALREALEYLAPPRPRQAPGLPALGRALARLVGRVVQGRRLASRSTQGTMRWAVLDLSAHAPPTAVAVAPEVPPVAADAPEDPADPYGDGIPF